MTEPLSGRSCAALFVGKQTAVLKTTLTDDMHTAFERKARISGYASSSDCLRELVHLFVVGPDALANLHLDRIASLVQPSTKTRAVAEPAVYGSEQTERGGE